MTGYPLDRDVLSAVESPRGNRNVRAWIETVPDIDWYVSAITVMEARKGFARLRAKSRTVSERLGIGRYEVDFDRIVARVDDRVLPVDRAVADCWGEMLGAREANVMDTAVAATAIIHGLVVATGNVRHFRDRGVRLIDPFKARPTIT